MCIQTPGLSKRTKILSYFSSIFWSFYACASLFLMYSINKSTIHSETVHFFQAIGLHLTHLTVMLETLATEKKQLNFWKNLKNIERFYGPELKDVKLKYIQCKRIVVRKILILLGISLLIESIYVTNHFYNHGRIETFVFDVLSWILNIASVMVGRFQHMSHLIVIEILKVHLEIFNNSLMKLKGNINFFDDKSLIEELNLIKFRHTYIWELCKSINSCYLWSQMINFLINFLQLTSILYYIYYLIVKGSFLLFFRK
uniref:Gustatory receptor n=1 Tax=Lutzomyia longipalpis TaxID=7200 RepID=A0A7G3B355_LUTLO